MTTAAEGPTGNQLLVTTSWDDGNPADSRLADLLAKYGVAGTFYVPNRNSEGRPVLTEAQIKQLSSAFEIGGHSIDHVVLTRLNEHELARQIEVNKTWLEQVTGRPVRGFCYVQGRYNARVKAAVQRAGFDYARTAENFRAAVGSDPFELPTTVQFLPHASSIYMRNFVKGELGGTRTRLLWAALTSPNLEQRAERMSDVCRRVGGYFHLWGHSWELEERNLWGALENVLRKLAAEAGAVRFVTNHEARRAAVARMTNRVLPYAALIVPC